MRCGALPLPCQTKKLHPPSGRAGSTTGGLLFHGAEGETLAQIKASLVKDIKEVAAKTYLATEISPYQLYFKLLIEYFVRAIDYDPNTTEDLPKGFKRLSYQVGAVTQGVRLLQKHIGIFLADVVGLGKTIIATLIARKFFFRNGFPNHRSHTLIVVPPALLEQESSHQTTSKGSRLPPAASPTCSARMKAAARRIHASSLRSTRISQHLTGGDSFNPAFVTINIEGVSGVAHHMELGSFSFAARRFRQHGGGSSR